MKLGSLNAVMAAILLTVGPQASAQPGPMVTNPVQKADELVIGPITTSQSIEGITVDLVSTTYLSMRTQSNGLVLHARVVADLRDLQAKIGSIIDTINLPKNNCASFSANNPVATIWGKELKAEGAAATLWLHGYVDLWDCRENPIPNSKLVWVNDGPFGLSRPKVETWPGDPIKNFLAKQPFDISETVEVQKTSDTAVALKLGDPNVQLGGQFVGITNGILRIAGIDINSKAKEALQKAIDPSKLQASVPAEYLQLNPKVESVGFSSEGGHLLLHLDFGAMIPASQINEKLQVILSSLKPK